MSYRETTLWRALAAMRVEPDGAVAKFEDKLARESKWSRSFAAAVVEEYRRFLYLAGVAGHSVSPSRAVDRAWHLHLTYSRHYWEVLCGQILGRPLHHDPNPGGAAEDVRHADQYARTLDLYRETFGAEPPPAIWPSPIPRSRHLARRAGWLGAAAATGLLTACAAAAATTSLGEEEGDGVIIAVIVAVVFVAILLVGIRSGRRGNRRHGRRSGSHTGGGDCGSSDSWDSSDSSSDSSDGGSSCGGGCGGGGGD